MNMRWRRGTVLEVPFKEKDEAKKLGAWWDPEIKKWFVPSGKDTSPFERWIDSTTPGTSSNSTGDSGA